MGLPGPRPLRQEAILSNALAGEILAHCRAVFPEEGCGLVAADGYGIPVAVLPITNALRSPVRYQMDTREQFDAMKRIRKEEWTLWGIFHSHPLSDPAPSPTDVRLAYYPDCYYLIAGLATDPARLRCFTIIDGEIRETALRLEP